MEKLNQQEQRLTYIKKSNLGVKEIWCKNAVSRVSIGILHFIPILFY